LRNPYITKPRNPQQSQIPSLHYKSNSTKKNATSIRIPTLPKLRLTHIGVELSNKTGEIIVLEVLGQKLLRKLRRIPHNEAV
jgi:hypothetical protein